MKNLTFAGAPGSPLYENGKFSRVWVKSLFSSVQLWIPNRTDAIGKGRTKKERESR